MARIISEKNDTGCKMQIKLLWNNAFCPEFCSLCGYDFKAGLVRAEAYVDGIYFGLVCEICVQLGTTEIRKRMFKRAQALREASAEIETLAFQTIECPTWADWEKLHEEMSKIFEETFPKWI
jgi:hypothetical protein